MVPTGGNSKTLDLKTCSASSLQKGKEVCEGRRLGNYNHCIQSVVFSLFILLFGRANFSTVSEETIQQGFSRKPKVFKKQSTILM
jgi:hypothetical protein